MPPQPTSPPQRMDKLMHLADEVLHLAQVVAAIGSHPQLADADAVAVVAGAKQGIGDGVIQVFHCRSLPDLSVERGALAAPFCL